MDLDTSTRGDAQVDAFIERRHQQRVKEEGERPRREPYIESEEAYYARESRRLRWAWARWHEDMAVASETGERINAARHRQKAEALIAGLVSEEQNANGHKGGSA